MHHPFVEAITPQQRDICLELLGQALAAIRNAAAAGDLGACHEIAEVYHTLPAALRHRDPPDLCFFLNPFRLRPDIPEHHELVALILDGDPCDPRLHRILAPILAHARSHGRWECLRLTEWFRFRSTIITVLATRGLMDESEAAVRLDRWRFDVGPCDVADLQGLLERAMTARSAADVFPHRGPTRTSVPGPGYGPCVPPRP